MSVIGINACLQVVDLVSGLRTIGFEIDHVRPIEGRLCGLCGTPSEQDHNAQYQRSHTCLSFFLLMSKLTF